jgi:amino acid transporter
MADADLTGRDDVEKRAGVYNEKSSSDNSPDRYGKDEQMRRGSVTPHHEGFFSAFTLESFKRNPNARVVTEATDNEGRPLPDQPPAEPALAMKLKPRHLQMIAIGGSIGQRKYPGKADIAHTDPLLRYRSFRWIRIRPCTGWSSISHNRLWPDRCHVVLHCSRSW